ncbi:DUF4255 domain-containing protein [Aliiglaciecola sp. SL4]|uniref:DUF4255 domain-containing protein n=1 Tax=Aliiglaciecola sp. SL4 TaxID=3239806 RepID=UPI00355B3081
MADFASVAAVGSSLVRFLTYCFDQQQPIPGGSSSTDTTVVLARTEDLNLEDNPLITPPCLALFLYRVDFNSTSRAAYAGKALAKGRAHLPLEFHFLMIPWGITADQEYRILGRTIQCLEDHPLLTGPMLDPVTNWATNDSIQLSLEELSTEDLMRIFDSLPIDYKLCVPYMAKMVVMQGRRQDPLREVGLADQVLTSEVVRP